MQNLFTVTLTSEEMREIISAITHKIVALAEEEAGPDWVKNAEEKTVNLRKLKKQLAALNAD